MADICDEAEVVIQEALNRSLSQIPRYTGVSATECVECGDEIPEGRREAVKGVKLCMGCAEREALATKGVRRL